MYTTPLPYFMGCGVLEQTKLNYHKKYLMLRVESLIPNLDS